MTYRYRAVMPFGQFTVGDDVPADAAAEHSEKVVRVLVPDAVPEPAPAQD